MNEWCHDVRTVFRFYETKVGAVVAAIGKVGSYAIAKALIDEVWTDPKERERPNRIPKKVKPGEPQVLVASADHTPPQVSPWEPAFEGKSVIVPIRDPVERFRSACVQEKLDPEEALQDLEADGKLMTNYHFQPVADYLRLPNLVLIPFPQGMPYLSGRIGVRSIEPANVTKVEKPTLSEEQVARLRVVYSDDIDAWEAVK